MKYQRVLVVFINCVKILKIGRRGNKISGKLANRQASKQVKAFNIVIGFEFFHIKFSSQALTGFIKEEIFMIMKKFKTYQLAVSFYKNSRQLHLQEPIKNQFQKAALSIILNLAEGTAKPTVRDRRKFYYISLGSLREVQAILDIIGHSQLIKEADQLAGYLYKLCKNT